MCIDDSGTPHLKPPVIKGRTYIINDFKKCPQCDMLTVDVGLSSSKPVHGCTCGYEYEVNGIHWARANRFAPLKEEHEEKTEYKVVRIELPKFEPVLS